jgi:hypothetical protein
MDMVPLRDLFEAHQHHVDERFDRLERLVREQGKHSHPGLVPWAALIPMVVTLIVAVGLLS